MPSLQKSYAKQIHDGLTWGATWTPQTRVEVGDVGSFIDGVFVKATDLSLLEIPFATENAAYNTDLNFTSERGVSIDTKIGGTTSPAFQAVAEADAGIAISFKRDAGVAMALSGLDGERIRDRPALEQALRERFSAGNWPDEYAVVVERMKAQAATIVISRAAGTRVEFEAQAALPGGAAALAALSGGVSLAYADAMAQLIVAKDGLTPLFHTLRLKRSFWTGQVGTVFSRAIDGDAPEAPQPAAEPVGDDAFETIDFDPGD
jgi:hypothetical protein